MRRGMRDWRRRFRGMFPCDHKHDSILSGVGCNFMGVFVGYFTQVFFEIGERGKA